jgi:hypothetical protein
MLARKTLTELNEEKRLLLLESNLHRTLIRAECAAVHSQLGNLKSSLGLFQRMRTLFGIAKPISVQSLTGGAGRIAGLAAVGISAWKLWQSFNTLRGHSKAKQQDDSKRRA